MYETSLTNKTRLLGETVRGVSVLNHHLVIYGPRSWVQYSMRGEIEQTNPAPETTPYDDLNWEILCEYLKISHYLSTHNLLNRYYGILSLSLTLSITKSTNR